MRLDRIHIVGFKSFGEKAELSIHGGITAIVGPNGCGKSNISDAIGWALGEQSAKSLRGQKMEDLIFNGSDSRPALGFAEVSLHVTQLNGSPTGETREVLVTRRLHRSGESEYLIDGSPCRLRDVHDIFMDTGMGTKAYSIIEQGKIGLILSSKPADRRSLIEEAAGITKYKSRRRSAELKLEAAQQNLLRVNDIIYEIERQMSSLKRQAAKARRFRRLRDAMSHIEKIASVRRGRAIESRLAAMRRELRAVADEDLRRSTSLTTTETYREAAGLLLLGAEHELADLRERLHGRDIALERLDNRMASERRELSDLADRLSQAEAELSGLRERYGPAAAELDQRRRDEAGLAEEFSRAEEAAARTQRELSHATFALAEAEQEIEAGRAELVHRISKIAALHNFLQGVLANAEKVSSEMLKLGQEIREVESERAALDATAIELDSEIAACRTRRDRLASDHGEAEADLARLRAALAAAEQEMASRREELSGLAGRLASLEELVAARTHLGAGARNLLKMGASAGLELDGVVADFLEVEPRFERAAERFYGESLQRILVDSPEAALLARRVLEGSNVGRCDFLIASLAGGAERLRPPLDALSRKGARGVIGALSEAVRFTNGKAAWLSASLADAVVVESLEDALAAFRLEPSVPYVTLGGEVVGPPGVLSAGPGGPSEGLLSTRREIRELRESMTSVGRRIAELESEWNGLQSRTSAAEARRDALEEEQHSLEKDLVGLDHRKMQWVEASARNRRKAEVLSSEQVRTESERESLSAKRLEMEAALASEEAAKAGVESRLGAQVAALGAERREVEGLQARAAEEASSVAALRERLQAARVDSERLAEGVRELDSRLAAGQKERERVNARQSELRQDLETAERELATVALERDLIREKLSGAEAQAALLRRRIEETDVALKLRRRELEAVREARAQAEVALAREESELEHLVSSFQQAHGTSLAEAAAVLPPGDLHRDPAALEAELAELKEKLDAVGPVNLVALEQFSELETRFEFLTKQRQDLLDSIAATNEAIRKIDTTSRQRFEEAFNEVNRHFDVIFKRLFGGGRAGLSLIDEADLLESGIDISAQPPGKRLQNVLLLSGGEKALTAIALMFAIFRYKPSPFCLLDEVDAPLDDANLGRFLHMVDDLKESTQFVIITHSRKTMEMADQMYGVTMEEPGVSKLVSVNLVAGRPLEAAVATL